jgi:hypothetical protein
MLTDINRWRSTGLGCWRGLGLEKRRRREARDAKGRGEEEER